MRYEFDIAGCPKEMSFGPCGGVRNDESCEVDARPCPFLGGQQIPAVAARTHGPALHLPDPTILVDVRAPATWAGSHRELWVAIADALHGCVALLGEHVDNPSSAGDDSGALPATEVIAILSDAGVDVIATVTGRDRTLRDAGALMGAYRNAGVTAIHCVTGDHPAAVGIDRPARFGAEAITLIAAATDSGCPATVGESPASPGRRPERLALKQAAGAALCVLNHGGEATDLVTFADACDAAGATMPLIAPVPMVADRVAALGLANFPGVRLPHGYLDGIIEATDPTAAGLEASRSLMDTFAASGRFAGINLSGGAGGLGPWDRVALTSRFIEQARFAFAAATP
jgi:hypothetical protein